MLKLLSSSNAIPIVLDEFKKSEAKFDHQAFSQLVGIPVVPTVGAKGKGLALLFDTIISKYKQDEKDRKKIHINYGQDVENSLEKVRRIIHRKENWRKQLMYTSNC